MPIHPTRFSGRDRGSARDLKKSRALCIRNASQNPNADPIKEVAVKVLDRRRMILVNAGLLVLLALSVVGCALLGPVRLDLSQALQDMSSANPDAEILFRAPAAHPSGSRHRRRYGGLRRRAAGFTRQSARLSADAWRVWGRFFGWNFGTDPFSPLAAAHRRRAPR